MFRKAAVYSFGLLVTLSMLSGDIFACACCAEPGTRSEYTTKTDSYIRDLIKEIKFADKADLFMTEAGFDTITGIDPIRKEDEQLGGPLVEFSTAGSFSAKGWLMTIKSGKGLSATYNLPIPLKYTEFRVDIHDRTEMPLGPWLYKEIRFTGVLGSATGFAKAGAVRGTKYELVFSGRGVGCNEVEDFTHWRLDIDGPKAGYAFFGKLSSGRKDEPESTSAKLDTVR
ncbi:MAG TPA: hypothetical protein PLK77_14785 [Pyrinomonadaceae bacterium]|nr:hypothetical protein [Pyrinomonadaceae bacterium]